MTKDNVKEAQAIASAMVNWIDSQNVEPALLGIALTSLIAAMCSNMARSEAEIDKIVDLFANQIRQMAHLDFRFCQ